MIIKFLIQSELYIHGIPKYYAEKSWDIFISPMVRRVIYRYPFVQRQSVLMSLCLFVLQLYFTNKNCKTDSIQNCSSSNTLVMIIKYLQSRGICLQWRIRKLWQILSNECDRSSDRKIDIDFFFNFLGVICHFSINIRIEAKHFSKIYTWLVCFYFQMQTKNV